MVVKNDLHVSIIQTAIYWESPIANRAEIEEQIAEIKGKTDLILLPEMFTTGFSSNAVELAEPMNFTTHKWMKQMANQYNAAVCGSIIIKENNQFFNRLLFIIPSGETSYYDKKHLFGYGGEDKLFSPGEKKLIVKYLGWNICPLICYDLRFPVFSRNIDLSYDVLIYSASWPASRINVWNTLLPARAIENQSYVIGVNRIGTDGNSIKHNGLSQCI
jgi:predicted amidohydrolase